MYREDITMLANGSRNCRLKLSAIVAGACLMSFAALVASGVDLSPGLSAGPSGPRTICSSGDFFIRLAICKTIKGRCGSGHSRSFATKCAGCHQGGSNIFGGPTLKKKDLEKNNLYDLEALAEYIAKGNKKMPGFGEECKPKTACTFGTRLTRAELQKVAEFVLQNAENDWK